MWHFDINVAFTNNSEMPTLPRGKSSQAVDHLKTTATAAASLHCWLHKLVRHRADQRARYIDCRVNLPFVCGGNLALAFKIAQRSKTDQALRSLQWPLQYFPYSSNSFPEVVFETHRAYELWAVKMVKAGGFLSHPPTPPSLQNAPPFLSLAIILLLHLSYFQCQPSPPEVKLLGSLLSHLNICEVARNGSLPERRTETHTSLGDMGNQDGGKDEGEGHVPPDQEHLHQSQVLRNMVDAKVCLLKSQLASAWGWMEMGQRRRASDGHWQKTLVIHFQPSTDLESRFWTYKFTSHFHFLLSHYPLSLSYIHSPLHNNSARMQVVIRHQDSLTPHLRQPWGHPGHYFLWGNIRFQRILDGE